MGLRDEGLRESLRAQGLKQGGLRGSLRNLNSTGPDIPDSALSRYTFDDADTSGSTAEDVWRTNDATINGATTGVVGQYNEAYSIDGVDDRVETPINASTDLSDTGFTIGLWFKPANWNNGDFAGIIAAQDDNNDYILLGQDNGGGLNWQTNDGSIYGIEQASVGYTDGTYYFLCGRYSSSNGYFFDTAPANDTLTQFSSADTTLASVDEILYIGGINRNGSFSGGDSVAGDYDDPRFYNKFLSDAEVENWYSTGSING